MAGCDFKEKGKEYQFLAWADLQRKGYDVLNPNAQQFYLNLLQEIGTRAKETPTDKFLTDLGSCLNRLDGVLLQSSRIANHLEEIKKLPQNLRTLYPGSPTRNDPAQPSMLYYNPEELILDFESLILHSSAALDRLSVCISEYCYDCKVYDIHGKVEKMYFSRLREGLMRSQQSDLRAEHLLRLMEECQPELWKIIVSDGSKTLRNHFAHTSSLHDLTGHGFVIHWLGDGRVLRFDLVIENTHGHEMPLVGMARSLTRIVSYIVLKSVGIFLARTAQGALMAHLNWAWQVQQPFFEPMWENPMIFYRDYLAEDGQGQPFTVAKATNTTVTITNHILSNNVFDRAVRLN